MASSTVDDMRSVLADIDGAVVEARNLLHDAQQALQRAESLLSDARFLCTVMERENDSLGPET